MYKIKTTRINDYLKIGKTAIIRGSFSTTGGNPGSVETVNVTFSTPFGKTPTVFCTAVSTHPYTKAKSITVANKTKNGFTAYVVRTDSSAETINYFAIGGA